MNICKICSIVQPVSDHNLGNGSVEVNVINFQLKVEVLKEYQPYEPLPEPTS